MNCQEKTQSKSSVMEIKSGEHCATERLNKMRSLVTLARPVLGSERHINLVMLEKGEIRSGVNACRRWYQGNELFITHKSTVILMSSHLKLSQILLSCISMYRVFDKHSVSFFISLFSTTLILTTCSSKISPSLFQRRIWRS